MTNRIGEHRSVRSAGVIAGTGLLAMSALAGFAKFAALDALVTPGDAARTARDIMASEGLFRLGIASWFVVIALDVVVAWALFRVFRPVSTGISMLAAWCRLVYAAVFMVAIAELVGAVGLLSNDRYRGVFDTDQLHAQALLKIDTFTQIWHAGLVIFGLHLLVVAYLAYRSGYLPKVLGILLGIAGAGYAFDGFTAVLSPGISIEIASFTFIGEFLLALWLVTRPSRRTLSPRFHEDPIGAVT